LDTAERSDRASISVMVKSRVPKFILAAQVVTTLVIGLVVVIGAIALAWNYFADRANPKCPYTSEEACTAYFEDREGNQQDPPPPRFP
jgi:hypothetical protein